MDWVELVLHRDQCRALMNVVMNLWMDLPSISLYKLSNMFNTFIYSIYTVVTPL
jgi:hypothetical protein